MKMQGKKGWCIQCWPYWAWGQREMLADDNIR